MLDSMVGLMMGQLQRQGREMRDQVYGLGLTLLLMGAALLLLILTLAVGGVAGYFMLRRWLPVDQSLGILAGAGALISLVILLVAMRVHPAAEAEDEDEEDDDQARQDEGKIDALAPGNPPGVASAMEHPSGEAELPAMEFVGTLRDELVRRGSQAADQGRQVVRQHPMIVVGVAFGLGILLTRSSVARQAVKVGAIWGGKKWITHYLLRDD